ADHKTPHIALAVGAVINFAVCAALVGAGSEPASFGWYGTIASFGFIVVYLMCSICAPVYLKKLGVVTTGDYAFGILGVVLMVASIIGSLYPVPTYPMNLLPYIFMAYMVVGAIWFFVLKARAPQTLLGIEKDMEVSGA
ncbi:MAG: APC family permease, partial [Alphaproteobacteria bacterium]|nr:APC family permease [Alphaproteobacteria bacterium]